MNIRSILTILAAVIVPSLVSASPASNELAATRIALACPMVTHVIVTNTGTITAWSTMKDSEEAQRCAQAVAIGNYPVNMGGNQQARTVSLENGTIVLE